MTAVKRAVAVLTLAAALFTGGCSTEPGSPGTSTPANTPGSKASSPPSTPPSPSPGAPEQRKAGGMRGITLPAWNTDDYHSPEAGTYLRQIAATGAQWVTFTPTWYQDTVTDPGQHTTGETASDDSLRHIIGLARATGLKVMLKPHVDLRDGSDRARIRPTDADAWFGAYTRLITHYARLAADTGVEQLAVGTELTGLSQDAPHWREVVAAVRAQYRGTLTYAANYDEYDKVPFWDALDVIGIDAYWPLADTATTDENRLRAAWQPIADRLAAFSAVQHRRILFTEAGYVSQRGTTTAPYSWTVSKNTDNDEQAAAYAALLSAFDGKPWWAGVCWWMWDDWPGAGETKKKLAYTPHGKQAETVLRKWWGGS
ncbi:glycoside hydrolase TIM-barrel-like domain-containing protein [Streptomyces gamaensis]|uniref:Glycoside hydrolase TIM-barrel-like domain-containing protein n=1 Tax=Streptomyces gamaensis TaxID=1763542 RepID=A0ABW0Z9K4_9ACTN